VTGPDDEEDDELEDAVEEEEDELDTEEEDDDEVDEPFDPPPPHAGRMIEEASIPAIRTLGATERARSRISGDLEHRASSVLRLGNDGGVCSTWSATSIPGVFELSRPADDKAHGWLDTTRPVPLRPNTGAEHGASFSLKTRRPRVGRREQALTAS
jgi:hypothetical protein